MEMGDGFGGREVLGMDNEFDFVLGRKDDGSWEQ